VLRSGTLTKIPLISPAETDLAYAAGQRVLMVHQRLVEFIKEGTTLAKIDAEVAKILAELQCKSCFLGYRIPRLPPFPSHACLSVDACVVHGTAGSLTKPLTEGMLLKVDIGVVHRGFIGDAAWTYAIKRYPSDQVRLLMESGKQSLARGVQMLKPGNLLIHWAREVQTCVEREYGFHLVRGLGGHGYGRKLHLPPFVSNVVPAHTQEWPESVLPCEPGMLVAVEPMIGLTTSETVQRRNEWPVYMADGLPSVHYEHDVLVTASGPRVLTEGMEKLPDIVG